MTLGGHHVEILLYPSSSAVARDQTLRSVAGAGVSVVGGGGPQVALRVQGLQFVASGPASQFSEVWASLVRSYEEAISKSPGAGRK